MYLAEPKCYLVQTDCSSYRFKELKEVSHFIGTYPDKVKKLLETGDAFHGFTVDILDEDFDDNF